MTSDSEVRALMQELQQLGVRLWLDERGAHAEPAEKLTGETREELRRLKSEVIEYLAEQGEEIVDYTAGDPEGKSHSDMRTLPRSAEELSKQVADADRTRELARRQYQGGMVVINGDNSFGHYMRQLVRMREQAEARARGEIPPQGRYATRSNLF